MPCGSHGVCSEGQCQCEEGWVGAACDQRACHPRCEEHGHCHDGTCICQPGWEGQHCNMGNLPPPPLPPQHTHTHTRLTVVSFVSINLGHGGNLSFVAVIFGLQPSLCVSPLSPLSLSPTVTHDLDIVVKGNSSSFMTLIQHCLFLNQIQNVNVSGTLSCRRLSRAVQRARTLHPGAERLALCLPGWMEWAWMQRCHGN